MFLNQFPVLRLSLGTAETVDVEVFVQFFIAAFEGVRFTFPDISFVYGMNLLSAFVNNIQFNVIVLITFPVEPEITVKWIRVRTNLHIIITTIVVVVTQCIDGNTLTRFVGYNRIPVTQRFLASIVAADREFYFERFDFFSEVIYTI